MKHFFALLALSAPLLGAAQTVPQQAAAAARPQASASPLRYQPMAPVGASALVQEVQDWKAANAAVGQYPRGHRDIVKWEKAQPPAPAAAKPPPEAPR
ncbi:hypothetical protein [Curvibacter sp. PAE-UM]|uniref:hypothetical protein n=1 Tax=Curvibacter sp. PAE-UM TaxID=1714344 RepID=UPI00070CE48D|nr:hypothetical protein [Curvibacter sp. PAE-UM]KRH98488.1 hypothetical protein AO057_07570 [Curvibacter sp. PAE-UM]